MPIIPQNKVKGGKTMEVKKVRDVIASAINDSRSRDPKGPDYFVTEIVKLCGNHGICSYKLAWTKLTELLVILDKADAKVLDAHDILNAMSYLLTTSVYIRDSASVTE